METRKGIALGLAVILAIVVFFWWLEAGCEDKGGAYLDWSSGIPAKVCVL